VGCDWVRQALSAELDGEADPSEAAAATSHVARCLSCRAWLTGARRVDRSVRGLRLSMPVPDQTAAVLARLESEPGAKAGAPGVLAVRLGLVAVAGANLTMAACLLFGVHIGVLEPVAEHAGRELAAFQAALAAAFLASAWDGRARGRLAMVATAMVLLVATDTAASKQKPSSYFGTRARGATRSRPAIAGGPSASAITERPANGGHPGVPNRWLGSRLAGPIRTSTHRPTAGRSTGRWAWSRR